MAVHKAVLRVDMEPIQKEVDMERNEVVVRPGELKPGTVLTECIKCGVRYIPELGHICNPIILGDYDRD